MPSPFPGMDPYLEDPTIFPGLHHTFIVYLTEFLQPRLPAPYYADVGSRAYVELSQRVVGPDVEILERGERADRENGNGGVAVATSTSTKPLVLVAPYSIILHDETRERSPKSTPRTVESDWSRLSRF